MKEIRVVVTMDCEPTTQTSHKAASGPPDFALSERAIRGYAEIAGRHGFPVTFFVHPETALGQPKLFEEMKGKGACLGLHMHPWKYATWKYGRTRFMGHFGGLTTLEQHGILSESMSLWYHALGERPLYFRPGTFSANDGTFQVLADLGFRGGSVSAPGRVYRDINAIWTGAEPDPHRPHHCFRQMRGTLEFANMPLSADVSKLLEGDNGKRMHADFRPDVDWPNDHGISYETIATNILTQVMARRPAVPVLNTISHNHYDYMDPAHPACRRFEVMLRELVDACRRAGVKPVGTTLAGIADLVLAQPARPEPFVLK